MKRLIDKDEFFDKQPPLDFVEYLRSPVHEFRPARFSRTEPKNGEVSVLGLYLDGEFPDGRELLQKSYEDFNLFLSVCGIAGDRYPIRFVKAPVTCFESFTVTVEREYCTVSANDTEGVRRALIYIEDEIISSEGPFLPLGAVSREPWMKERITRGFFSPTNRPPKNGDELLDEIDYYPDEYLNRLMHDGTNGIWIYSSFRQLIKSSIIKEYGTDCERRIEKLNRVIAKCQKYGVKVFIFAIEPMLWQDVAEMYPDMVGYRFPEGMATLCPHSERAKQYCYEAGKKLFTLCPELGGFISITAGERVTSCASDDHTRCPRCAAMTRGEVLSRNIENLFRGIREVKPDAHCISWTYGHRSWDERDIVKYVETAPSYAMLMQNFEDKGYQRQLGKTRQAMDYWLSYAGPSQMFELTAKAAKEHDKHLFAKMQICCSHEVATIPYVPSPGSVYQKMRNAYRLGVEGLMECWYFGNYPCFMSKAAGELSFIDQYDDEDAFLHRLASVTFGRSVADSVVKAWKCFEKGYRQYPINIMFSYYSPMHDGVVWELALKPKNFPPSRSWLLLDRPNGDRVCDSILTGHTLEEVLELLGRMERYYSRAIAVLDSIDVGENDRLVDLVSVSRAFVTLCRSAKNVMEFYYLRDMLGVGKGDPLNILDKMRTLVEGEIRESETMIELCQRDLRLGYHSEAEGFKFFPEKLRRRIHTLEELLDTEFTEVRERITRGEPPLEYYLGIESDCQHSYTVRNGNIEDAPWEYLADNSTGFRIAEDESNLYIDVRSFGGDEITVWPEFELFKVSCPGVSIAFGDGKMVKSEVKGTHISEHWPCYPPQKRKRELARWMIKDMPCDEGVRRVLLTLKKKDFGIKVARPFKLMIRSSKGLLWESEPYPVHHLGKGYLSPGSFGWVHYERESFPFV
jgi:hypothetical protein